MVGRVFIPQEVQRRTDYGLTPAYDFSPAMRYGDLVVVIPAGPPIVSIASVMPVIQAKLDGFCDDDFVIATGDPALIVATCMIATWINSGRVKLLRWDRLMRTYQVMDLDERDLVD